MILPHAKDCEQIEYFVGDFLALAQGLILAYPDPGFRAFIEPERQELIDACRGLLAVLASPERDPCSRAAVERRAGVREPAL